MRIILIFIISFFAIESQAVTLRPNAPARYVVQPGDTLWGIATRYLVHPWEWPALWHADQRMKNPNLIYPGAVLLLNPQQARPYLRVLSNGTIKLSPHIRPMPLNNPIPPISLHDIKPFLNGSLALDHNTLREAPFIMAFKNEHMLGSQGDEVYVKNLCPDFNRKPGSTYAYGIYRPCGVYRDGISNCIIGYKAILVGYAELVQAGDPAMIRLTDITEGVRIGDRVMPNNYYPDFALNFEPRAPLMPINGEIIDVLGDYTQGAEGLVTVIDRGKDVGLQAGDVLGVYSQGRCVGNPKYPLQCVKLPPERIGEIMVFRTFTHTSFALVMRAIRAIKRLDKVTNP